MQQLSKAFYLNTSVPWRFIHMPQSHLCITRVNIILSLTGRFLLMTHLADVIAVTSSFVDWHHEVSLWSHASGAAGFLRTRPGPDREGVAGGNLGLRDILAALQWVRHNIAAFGGDPSRVTVLGHDTGAALVNLLLISSATKGNFEGLIRSV